MGYEVHFEGSFAIAPPIDGERVGPIWRANGGWLDPVGDAPLGAELLAPAARALEGRVRWIGEDGATGTLVARGGAIRDEPDQVDDVDEDVRTWVKASAATIRTCAWPRPPRSSARSTAMIVAARSRSVP